MDGITCQDIIDINVFFMIHPFDAEATFAQSTKMQKSLKNS